MSFRMIGNPGNVEDLTGYGSVGYEYRLSTYEVSRGMIDAYNSSGDGPPISMFDYEAAGWAGGNRAGHPATGVSWNEAARFVNWLNTDSGFSEAYKFVTSGSNDNIELWTAADTGYDPANPFRNRNAFYFLPSEDEWYKAAYYDPEVNLYWDYATRSNSAPRPVENGTGEGTAVYRQGLDTGPADVNDAGGLSAYGTMAQTGNAWEWTESGVFAPNDSADENRVVRGGFWNFNSLDPSGMSSGARNPFGPSDEVLNIGFRVVSVPEPSTSLLVLLSFGVLFRRTRD